MHRLVAGALLVSIVGCSHVPATQVLPFVKAGGWGRCGYWETTVMPDGVAIQRHENQCQGFSLRQVQVYLTPEQIQHLQALIAEADFGTLPLYVASLQGPVPQNPNRITVWQNGQEYEVSASNAAALEWGEGKRFNSVWGAITALVPPP